MARSLGARLNLGNTRTFNEPYDGDDSPYAWMSDQAHMRSVGAIRRPLVWSRSWTRIFIHYEINPPVVVGYYKERRFD